MQTIQPIQLSSLLVLLLLFAGPAMGQVMIYSLDFETPGGYSTSISEFTDGETDYFKRTDGSDISRVTFSGIQGNYYFAAQDIDGEDASLPVHLTINDINVLGYTDLTLKVLLAEDDAGTSEDWDDSDYVHFDAELDNSGSYSNLLWIENDGTATNAPPFIDTDFDGTGDGTEITSTFTAFTQTLNATGNTLDIRVEFDLNSGDEDIAIDQLELTGIPATADPQAFSAHAQSSSQIDLNFARNSNGDQVVIVHNSSGNFSTPSDTPPAAGHAFAGGTVLYKGISSPQSHTGLTAEQTFYYKAWSYNNGAYSAGLVAQATTPRPEPSAHATAFTATSNAYDQVELSWTDATGAVLPDGYLIKANETGAFTAPNDGTDPGQDPDLSDGSALVKVLHGEGAVSFKGLNAQTTYYFKIWPYTNTGTQIDYKTDGSTPEANTTTAAATALIINEFLADPPTGSAGDANGDGTRDNAEDEFVELYNPTASSLDVSGWTIHDELEKRHEFPAEKTLPAKSFVVVFGGGTPTGTFGGSLVQTASEGSLSLNNSGDEISIRDSNGEITSYTYGSEGGNDESLTRKPNFTGSFVAHSTAAGSGTAVFSPGERATYVAPAQNGNWTAIVGETDYNTRVHLPAGTSVTIPASKATRQCYDLTLASGAQLANKGVLVVHNHLLLDADASGKASLLNTGTLDTKGTTTVKQYLAETSQTYNWHYVAVPFAVNAGTFPGVDPGSGTVYASYWDEQAISTSDGWQHVTGETEQLTPHRGYAVASNSASTLNFSKAGNPLQSADLSYTDLSITSGYDKAGFHLLPNPYTAALDADQITATGWSGDIWVRSNGTFLTYNTTSGVGQTPLTGGIIPALQSFWVKIEQGSNAMSYGPEDLTNDAGPLYKKATHPLLRLQVTHENYSDQAVVYFHPEAARRYEAYDSEKMFARHEDYPQIYSISGGHKLAINGHNLLYGSERVIKLGFKAAYAGNFTLHAADLEHLPGHYRVILTDRYSGNTVNLREKTSYNFSTTAAGEQAERFRLLFSPGQTTGIADKQALAPAISMAEKTMRIEMPQAGRATIQLFDLTGRSVFLSQKTLQQGLNRFPLSLKTGVYLVQLRLNKKTHHQKIIIH